MEGENGFDPIVMTPETAAGREGFFSKVLLVLLKAFLPNLAVLNEQSDRNGDAPITYTKKLEMRDGRGKVSPRSAVDMQIG
jgi:hypothetical protein